MTKFFSALLLLTVLATPVYAQQEQLPEQQPEVVIRDSEGIKLKMVKQTQNPSSKEVIFDLVIYSLIESDRVQVTWTVSGVSELLTEPTSVLSVKTNSVYERQAIIRPRNIGLSTITARVEAFEAKGTFVSTATIAMGSLEDGTVFPSGSQYGIANLMIVIRLVFTVILVLYILGATAIFGYLKYQEFLKKDERQF